MCKGQKIMSGKIICNSILSFWPNIVLINYSCDLLKGCFLIMNYIF